MQGTMRSAVIGWMSGAKELAGYGDPREWLAGRLYGRRIVRRGAHVVEQGAALLGEATGVELVPAAVELPREAEVESWAAELVDGQRVSVLSAGAGWGAKRWPVERFGELARRLRGMGFAVVVNAPREDDAVASAVVAASGGVAEMVVCNMSGLIALVRRAALVVGGDSGPVHLAAALGVPVVALFGPTDPARNGPWGSGPVRVLRDAASVTSYKRNAETDSGLARISVEEVLEVVLEMSGSR
jgi:heptosyltransferase-1